MKPIPGQRRPIKRVIPRGIFPLLKREKNDGRRTIVRKHASALAVFVVLLAVLPLAAQAPSHTALSPIQQIKEEGLCNFNSKIMGTIRVLIELYGPRLATIPN